MMKFELDVRNPELAFRDRSVQGHFSRLGSSNLLARHDGDGEYLDIPRFKLSLSLLTKDTIKAMFASILKMTDMPDSISDTILSFVEVERKKKDPFWKPTINVFGLLLHPTNPFPAAPISLCQHLNEKRPMVAIIRNITRVTQTVDDYWFKCMNFALENPHGHEGQEVDIQSDEEEEMILDDGSNVLANSRLKFEQMNVPDVDMQSGEEEGEIMDDEWR